MSSPVNDNPVRRVLFTAGIAGALGVLIGAFTAHGLENFLIKRGLTEELAAKRVSQADVGVRYQLLHSAALLGVAAASSHYSRRSFRTAVVLMIAGIILFSGSLYLLVLLNLPVIGAITPLGGLSWIAGWLWLAFSARSTSEL